jgi:hypothetical protein
MIATAQPPINEMLSQLTSEQKWEAFQYLWNEVAEKHSNEIEPPAWHSSILQEREERIRRGEATWIPLEDAVKSLEAKFA